MEKRREFFAHVTRANFSGEQLRVLCCLLSREADCEISLRQNEVAEILGMTESNVSRAIKTLKKTGVLRKTDTDSSDGRPDLMIDKRWDFGPIVVDEYTESKSDKTKEPNLFIKFAKKVWEEPDPKLLNELYLQIGTNTWLPDEPDATNEGPYVRVHVPKITTFLEKLLTKSMNVWEWDKVGLYRYCAEHATDSCSDLPESEMTKSTCRTCGQPATVMF